MLFISAPVSNISAISILSCHPVNVSLDQADQWLKAWPLNDVIWGPPNILTQKNNIKWLKGTSFGVLNQLVLHSNHLFAYIYFVTDVTHTLPTLTEIHTEIPTMTLHHKGSHRQHRLSVLLLSWPTNSGRFVVCSFMLWPLFLKISWTRFSDKYSPPCLRAIKGKLFYN